MPSGGKGLTQSQLEDLYGPEQNENVEPLAQKARKRWLFVSVSFSLSVMVCVSALYLCTRHMHIHVCAFTSMCLLFNVTLSWAQGHSEQLQLPGPCPILSHTWAHGNGL